MSPHVFETFESIARRHWSSSPQVALEIGAARWTLLEAPIYRDSQRIALNLTIGARVGFLRQCDCVVANGNALPFADSSVDCVLSSSVLEHDRYFWRSVQEIRRILRRGGLFIVGVPAYMTLPTDMRDTTLTFRRHGLAYDADFYRFSEQAVREVLLEGLSPVDEIVVRRYPNPYVIAAGRKEA